MFLSLSWGMIGKAVTNARNSVLLGLERLGVISGKAQQELPASGSSVKVMSQSEDIMRLGGIEQLSDGSDLEVSVELGELEEFEGGG